VAYVSAKWLWLFAILFHYGFLIRRHPPHALFHAPVPTPSPRWTISTASCRFLTPTIYISDLLLIGGVSPCCFCAAFFDAKVRFFSLVNDYFPPVPHPRHRAFRRVHALHRQGGHHVHQGRCHGSGGLQLQGPAGVDVSFFVHLSW
jgi:hypothetical protein